VAPSDPRTDSDLIAASNAGDAGAFEGLYYRYRDWVVRLALRFTGHHEDALDVLQDTFAYLLRKLPNLRLSARMTTFLYPVVRNLALARRHHHQPLSAQPRLPRRGPVHRQGRGRHRLRARW
jgi:RNA polymerase sigma-70 factor (ECF subfamily)